MEQEYIYTDMPTLIPVGESRFLMNFNDENLKVRINNHNYNADNQLQLCSMTMVENELVQTISNLRPELEERHVDALRQDKIFYSTSAGNYRSYLYQHHRAIYDFQRYTDVISGMMDRALQSHDYYPIWYNKGIMLDIMKYFRSDRISLPYGIYLGKNYYSFVSANGISGLCRITKAWFDDLSRFTSIAWNNAFSDIYLTHGSDAAMLGYIRWKSGKHDTITSLDIESAVSNFKRLYPNQRGNEYSITIVGTEYSIYTLHGDWVTQNFKVGDILL